MVRRHYRGRVAALVGVACVATVLEALGPFALGRLVNAVTAAANEAPPHDYGAILFWFGALGLLWFVPSLLFRLHDAIDREMSPRLRGSPRNTSSPG